MNYLCEKRNRYYHLNHFNIHQLTYLCKKISSEAADFPHQVYQLLSVVDPNISAAEIVACLEEVTKIDDLPDDEDDSFILGIFLIQNIFVQSSIFITTFVPTFIT